MNVEILRAVGIDYDNGVKRFIGKADVYEKALSKFPQDKTFERIRTAYNSTDRKRLFEDVHEFKGMCGNIGLTTLYSASDAVMRILRASSFTENELKAAYLTLESEYKKVFDAVSTATEYRQQKSNT